MIFFRFSKKSCFLVFLVHPTVVLVLLSASVERCFEIEKHIQYIFLFVFRDTNPPETEGPDKVEPDAVVPDTKVPDKVVNVYSGVPEVSLVQLCPSK